MNNINSHFTLNNGIQMPCLGLGVYLIPDGKAVEQAIVHALNVGYRCIDTAKIYNNERGTGTAIKHSATPRETLFITTKVWNDDQRAQRTLAAFDESLERLGLDYVDLYLVHWPVKGFYLKTWQAMEEIYQSGRARAIGVSNFTQTQLEHLLQHCQIPPAVNQVEFHPQLAQPALLEFCQTKNIQVQAWSPLMQGEVDKYPEIIALAEKYNKTPAQVILRWNLQQGVATIPKSANPERIKENAAIFDFELQPEDMRLIQTLNRDKRIGPDPLTFDF